MIIIKPRIIGDIIDIGTYYTRYANMHDGPVKVDHE